MVADHHAAAVGTMAPGKSINLHRLQPPLQTT